MENLNAFENSNEFIKTNHTKILHEKIAKDILNLEFSKSTLDRAVEAIEVSRRYIPVENKKDIYKCYLAKPEEEIERNDSDQTRYLYDMGRILMFLSENKNNNQTEVVKTAQEELSKLDKLGESSKYTNYRYYIGWITNEKDRDKFEVLIKGKSAKTAMMKMIDPALSLLATEESKPLIEDNQDKTILDIFLPSELNGRLIDLPPDKADKIREKFSGVDIKIEPNIKINIPRESKGAGQCGDIENAVVEGLATFVQINKGDMFLYISAIGNTYMITDKVIEGERGGIIFPYTIYSIPKPLHIKLVMAEEKPNRIEGITEISLKPVREFASRSKTANTVSNDYYDPRKVRDALNATLDSKRELV